MHWIIHNILVLTACNSGKKHGEYLNPLITEYHYLIIDRLPKLTTSVYLYNRMYQQLDNIVNYVHSITKYM